MLVRKSDGDVVLSAAPALSEAEGKDLHMLSTK